MMKTSRNNLIILISLFFVATYCYGEEPIKVFFANKKEVTVNLNEDTTKLLIFKNHFRAYGKTSKVEIANFTPIENITGISELPELEKLSIVYSFNDIKTLEFIKSTSLKILDICSGFSINSFDFLKTLPNLEALGLNWFTIKDNTELDFSRTKLEYLELSRAELNGILSISIPSTLKYLNLSENLNISLSKNLINQMVENGTIIIYEKEMVKGIKTLHPLNDYDQIPKRFVMNRP